MLSTLTSRTLIRAKSPSVYSSDVAYLYDNDLDNEPLVKALTAKVEAQRLPIESASFKDLSSEDEA